MPKGRPTHVKVTLTPEDRRILASWVRSTTIAYGLHQRARLILLMAQGRHVTDIAATVGISRTKVYKWTARYLAHGTEGLWELPRRGQGGGP